jgi:arylsulfatase A-like enzyme
MRPAPELMREMLRSAAGEDVPWERWPRPHRMRRAVVTLMCVSLVVAGAGVVGTRHAQATGGGGMRPNILIIMTDDQRARGTMKVLPHVRRWFGSGGTTFPNAFDTTPLCCPSRAATFSGRYAHNNGVHDNAGTGRQIFDQSATMQRYLHDAGYETGIYGKFFNFWRIADDPPNFDRFGIISPSRDSNGYYGGTWNVDGTLTTIDRYSTDYIAASGARFIRNTEGNDAQPWFLELATYAPHLHAIPKPRYSTAPVGPLHLTPAMEELDRSDKPPSVQAENVNLDGVRRSRAVQLRTLMSVDDLTAKIAQTLRQTGEAGNTLAFFLSDNGFLWGEHGLRSKGYPYDAGVRLPFLMRWTGHTQAGSVDRRLVATIDIAPTVMAASGLAAPQDPLMDGRSLLDPSWSRDRLLLEYWPWIGSSAPGWAATWTKRSEYVEYYDSHGAVTFREYYDLRADPFELTNLFHDANPSNDPAVPPLHRQLAADRTCSGATCP